MTNNVSGRALLVDLSRILLIGVFLYSAASKVLDYHDFYHNLMRSPLFKMREVPAVSYSIIIVEFATAAMLLVPRAAKFAFAVAFFLLVSFTLYLIAVFLLSQDVPCPCGGILSKLGFGPHIMVNLIAATLAAVGFVKYEPYDSRP